ncbi:AAA domain-containing protein [Fimicolochytrium jonesii]|uniref:AAA domain-containing protein n=1 Tax=Fimicolochytrium jonesii TaxID=1396493 RepID=UPI0022FF085A|nr:AAA domain-containing protein [Fimicolochytrium jonesii]KAI8820228.1 AAA domain-containing protein [Fimicolochytrium jonesii]
MHRIAPLSRTRAQALSLRQSGPSFFTSRAYIRASGEMSSVRLASAKRIDLVRSHLSGSSRLFSTTAAVLSDSDPERVCIGDVCINITPARQPQYVPIEALLSMDRQDNLEHLQWMMRKDLLGQDMFLIGPPGPLKRHLALTYLHLTDREHEYVALHRDTSAESDLKQRREIVRESGAIGLTAQWVDGVAVKAAIEGRVLVIEGIEKAERNVLPVLNNLLENREMSLEDGRHIVHPSRYDALLKDHSKEELDSWRLVRASEHFRVIALGVPVPPYPGNPLDPPFRSRFQVRYVESPYDGSEGRSHVVGAAEPPADLAAIGELLAKLRDVIRSIKYTHEIQDQVTISSGDGLDSRLLPHFPQTAVGGISDLLTVFPDEAKAGAFILPRFWPAAWIGNALNNEQTQSFQSLAKQLGLNLELQLTKNAQQLSEYELSDVSSGSARFLSSNGSVIVPIEMGATQPVPLSSNSIGSYGGTFVHTPRYRDVISRIAQAHALGADMCLVGPKGSGKTTAIMRFAALFGFETETLHMYRDMTARDVLQRRGTRSDGSTFWENSGLVRAALEGKIAVLDGLHWVRAGTIAALQRLVQDREAFLPDGTILTSAENFGFLKERMGQSTEQLNAAGVFSIHPAFRIIATSSVVLHHKAQKQDLAWLTEEIGAMFQFIEVGSMTLAEEAALLQTLTGCPQGPLKQLLNFAAKFRQLAEGGGSGHETVLAKSASLSTRQLLRICRRVAKHPDESLYTAIHRTCLSPFLPQLARQALEDVLIECGISPVKQPTIHSITTSLSTVSFGDVHVPRYTVRADDAEARALIPQTTAGGPGFFDNEVHTRIMREIAIDFSLGEHLLLIGNQGVGKNRLTDRFLELIGRPREYVQLHRDTTVQSLTVQPFVEDGVIIYKDSPLVRAARKGRVLIVDEADKAPVYITSILKSLAETGEMPLADGRRIRPAPLDPTSIDPTRDIILHPEFQIIVLANRPGYPFLGNDFFGAIGEVFSCHAVENPDAASELQLLRQFAPHVDLETLSQLVGAFGELRRAFDDGLVAYPYSLRELMNLLKHMQRFPDEPLDQVLRNVFDFDVHRKEFFEVLVAALEKHGLNVRAVGMRALKRDGEGGAEKKLEIKWEKGKSKAPPEASGPKHGKEDDQPHVGGNQWAGGSGGSDTAGIGGRAGPYRLHKKGQPIVRLPDDVKNDVPEHVKEAARKMGREALMKRLEEIKMSTHEATVYRDIYNNVRTEIRQLRVILEGVQAREKERTWLQNQTDGELDEAKIVEGLTGETAIYKRRGEETPEHGAIQKKPKRLKFVFDVSASMYSYNEHDGRLNRSLETALMIMESLQSLGDKYVYDIVGHSGDSECIVFVPPGQPPADEMERLRVLQSMSAHSQYCFSGDTTLKATERAVKDIVKDDADDYFTLVMSDANLRRYGIQPAALAKIVESDPKVNAAVLFIGSLGEEAKILTRNMPPGKAFVALNTSDIPKILKEIFTAIA